MKYLRHSANDENNEEIILGVKTKYFQIMMCTLALTKTIEGLVNFLKECFYIHTLKYKTNTGTLGIFILF